MKAIVFADRLGVELQPLTDRTCVALLPLACKPVIQYTIEDLADAGIIDVLIATSPFGDQIRARLGDGARWGLQIDYLPTRGEERPSEILRRIGAVGGEELVLLRGDTLRSRTVRQFLAQAQRTKTDVVAGGFEAARTSMIFHCGPNLEIDQLHWPPTPAAPGHRREFDRRAIALDEFQSSALDTIEEYFQANLLVADGKYSGLLIAGTQKGRGLICGRRARISPAVLGRSARVFVGAGSIVSSRASLCGRVVISDNAVIDRDAVIDNSVILPSTFVGQSVVLRNAIACGSQIVDVASGKIRTMDHRFKMVDLNDVSLAGLLTGVVNRMLGVLLLVASSPLWPVAAVASAFNNPNFVLRKFRIRTNRRRQLNATGPCQGVASAWQFSTSIPLLRDLPMLWAVVRGDLRVIGIRKLDVPRGRFSVADTEKLIEEAPCGLIGPAQLSLPRDVPPAETALTNAYYARTRCVRTDLRYLLVGLAMLCSKRAWIPPASGPA